ncbi:MAG: imidazole glycerol phosphate synthase subunit HisH [Gemmatimonadaceae bacterium]
MLRVGVIDYGMGNIGSICKMLRLVGAEPIVSADPAQLQHADKLVLPGVGHFDRAMSNLAAAGLIAGLHELVVGRGTPILGICLGMQLMCEGSEEGSQPGLAFVQAHVRRFVPTDSRLKVPHMGWAALDVARPSTLLAGVETDSRFYFVHSYYVDCTDANDVLARTTYGAPFVSAFARGNIFGVQFHPEKSHRFGIQLFRNFVGAAR